MTSKTPPLGVYAEIGDLHVDRSACESAIGVQQRGEGRATRGGKFTDIKNNIRGRAVRWMLLRILMISRRQMRPRDKSSQRE